jgi:transportin-1
MAQLIEQLDLSNMDEWEEDDESGFSVVNNACWSCGEIALKQQSGMAPYVERLFTRLLAIIQVPNIPSSLTENAAIAMGRLGLDSHEELAPHLATFAEPFLDALETVAETEEKDSAFRGFALIIAKNPHALEACLDQLFHAVAEYGHPSPDLAKKFQEVSLT